MNRALIQDLYPDVHIGFEERCIVHQLSKEFLQLKKSNVNDLQYSEWRRSVRERFGREKASRLLEVTREHVLGVEAALK